MNAELKERWITALRSREYKQGTGNLCTVEYGTRFYCCLGVVANIIDPNGWVPVDYNHDLRWHGNISDLPDKIATGIGLYNQSVLIEMNDDEEAGFNEIADWIETNL